jgi:hypothetical protein
VVILTVGSLAWATPPLPPDEYDRIERGYVIASAVSVGLGNGFGLVTMIGGSVELRREKPRRVWAGANVAMGLLNLSLATAWTIYGGVGFAIGEPAVFGSIAAHAGIGVSDLILGGIGVRRWEEARQLQIAPMAGRDPLRGSFGGLSARFVF